MKTYLIFLLAAFSAIPDTLHAQTTSESPVEHMDFLGNREEELSRKYMSYMSEVAHGGKARKMEKRREDVVQSLREAIRDAGKLRPFKGDASLRDAFREYWTVLLSIFNEDYHKIVDMEEVAERSYDMMEAVILTQEMADEKLNNAYDKVREAQIAFAGRHNVTLTQGQASKLDRKLRQVALVNRYDNQLYLIYFKSSVQESLMIEALNAKDINAVEQLRNSMLKYADEGLKRLDTIKTFNGDGSMVNACRKVLEFQKVEAGRMDAIVDFHLKSDELEKSKKAFETKPPAKRTKEDVDAFNQAVADFNKSVNEYNKVNHELNTNRSRVLENWSSSRKRFMDRHVPRG